MKRVWRKVLVAIWAAIFLLNGIAWISPAFCDWYIRHIFPVSVNVYGRMMGFFPFSVGEIMLVLAVILVCLTLLLLGARGLGRLLPVVGTWKKWGDFCTFSNQYFKGFLIIASVVSLVMTLNCFILYHGSTFPEKYFNWSTAGTGEELDFSLEELIVLRNFIVERCNTLSAEMQRDARGYIVYMGDMERTAIASMQKLGETYPNLRGFYPRPKPLFYSDFFSQQHMAGYYFPFSMEANYNDVMYIMNKPSTMCHELAHIKGYIYEDEANFISYLACTDSEDPLFVYSGYLSVLYYVDNDFYKAINKNMYMYLEQPAILPIVHEDNIFLLQEEWDRIEEKALLDTEVVDAMSDSFTDATLKWNGISDGIISYNRVVKLLLQYHDRYGYPGSETAWLP